MSQPVILAAKRTPIGRFLGGLSRTPSPQLGAYAISECSMKSPRRGITWVSASWAVSCRPVSARIPRGKPG